MTQLERGTDFAAIRMRRWPGIVAGFVAVPIASIGSSAVTVAFGLVSWGVAFAIGVWLFLRPYRSPFVPDLQEAVALGDLELAGRLLDRHEAPTRTLVDQALANGDDAMARLLISAWRDPAGRNALAAALPSRDA